MNRKHDCTCRECVSSLRYRVCLQLGIYCSAIWSRLGACSTIKNKRIFFFNLFFFFSFLLQRTCTRTYMWYESIIFFFLYSFIRLSVFCSIFCFIYFLIFHKISTVGSIPAFLCFDWRNRLKASPASRGGRFKCRLASRRWIKLIVQKHFYSLTMDPKFAARRIVKYYIIFLNTFLYHKRGFIFL